MKMSIYHKMCDHLGIRSADPTAKFLARVVDVYTRTVPYENLTKLRRTIEGNKSIPTAEEFFEYLQRGLGGTCFTVNHFLCEILRFLGFQASLVRGTSERQIRDHAGLRVHLNEEVYAIDAGFMFPEPGPFLISEGVEKSYPLGERTYRFVARPNKEDYALEVVKDGEVRRAFNSEFDCELIDFDESITRSFQRERMFMGTVVCCIRHDDGFKTLWGNEFSVSSSKDKRGQSDLTSDKVEALLKSEFGISGVRVHELIEFAAENKRASESKS